MKFVSFFIAALLFSASSFAMEKWSYTAFPYVAKNNPLKAQQTRTVKVGKLQLNALMTRSSGTHAFWGVEQVYANRSLKKKIFVKYGVQLSSVAPLGSWLKVSKGHVLHLKKGNAVVAYFAQGLNNVELFDAQKHFLNEGGRKVSILEMFNPISCAHAETVGGGEDAATPAQGTAAPGKEWYERAGNVVGCVGQETLNNAMAAGQELVKNANWENFSKGAQDMGAAALDAVPTWDEAMGGLQATGNFLFQTASDPVGAWNGVTGKFDETTQMVAKIYQDVASAIDGFSHLDADVQDRIICDAVASLAADGILGVALAATGAGAGFATAKLAIAVARYAAKIKPLMSMLHHISSLAHLGKEKMLETVNKLLKGQMSESELAALRTQAGQSVTNNLENENLRIKGLSEPERAQMLQTASGLNDTQRVQEAATSLGRTLTSDQQRALISAHNVAIDKGYGQYTPTELRQKMQILADAGFSPKESELLMRKGLAGQMSTGNMASAQVNFGPNPPKTPVAPAASTSFDSLAASKEMFASQQQGYALLAEKSTAANASFRQASNQALNIAKQTEYTRPEIATANLQRSIALPVPVSGNLSPTIELARRLDIYKGVTADSFEAAYGRQANQGLYTFANFGKSENYQQVVAKYNNLTVMQHLWEDGYRTPNGPGLYEIRDMLTTYKSLLGHYQLKAFKP